MFFFIFYGEIGELQYNKIVQDAFNRILFKKLLEDGYCDINPLLKSLNKHDILKELSAINSPLQGLFRGKYAKSTEELEQKMLPALHRLEKNSVGNKKPLEEYNYFAIVYYIFQKYTKIEEKEKCIKDLYKEWNAKELTCDIGFEDGIVYDKMRVSLKMIHSIKDYAEVLFGLEPKLGKELFYRGHGKISYELIPSLFRRNEWLKNEKEMYLQLLMQCPREFEGLSSHIERLAEMQHYGLPTRLFDITKNPLIALFFACESQPQFRGEVILFECDSSDVKYSQSDTVALLASLPLFTYDEQKRMYDACKKGYNSELPDLERLVSEVRLERPGFKSEVKAKDILNIAVCIPARKNKRIENQEGAFIVCGLLPEKYEENNSDITSAIASLKRKDKENRNIICIIEDKTRLLKELEKFGINKAKVYPEIDDVADYVKNLY